MSISNYEIAVQQMYRFPSLMHFCGPCDEKAIVESEQTLKLTFPTAYRKYVSEFGAGNFGGLEIYGLICDGKQHFGIPNAIWLTEKLRNDTGLSSEYLVISEDGMGGYICLNCQLQLDSESPVMLCYLLQDKFSGDSIEIAKSFGDFFLDRVSFFAEYN